ncbi:epithelial-stromal interaction protein 1-like [Carassius carassius]|uniref:epithelial-stromal interaction protein 1-like n=1 Tax=Carassius carassius TaxID=217509 RepID=UPI00286894BB|nr:epithelial-stromal interaction protein 1-like [Carassius carassius]
MNRSTHLQRNPRGSRAYRGNEINQNSNMTNNEQRNEKYSPNVSTSNAQNQPTHADGYTKIPPNESKWSKLQRTAQEGEEKLRRLKEENRPGPIQLAPERLGGAESLAEVRQRQQEDLRRSKLRKKLQKEEMDQNKRQAEEQKNERMKALQREKATKLEMSKKQRDEQRQKLYQDDKQMKTEEFLQRIERSSSSVSMAASNSMPASSRTKNHEYREVRREEENADLLKKKEEQRRKAEVLEEKQKQQEEDRKRRTEADHQRVNMAFLNHLEAGSSGMVPESTNVWLDDDDDDDDDELQDTALSTVPNPSQVHTDCEEEDDCGHMWTLMKLQNRFPYYELDMLEEIIKQCNGNYQQAYELLDV